MPPRDKPEATTQSEDEVRFKAVVKRLLDTPPQHKTTKVTGPSKSGRTAKDANPKC
jgi:hypothetical protein